MPVIEVVLSIKQDGVEIFSAPLRRRAVIRESTGPFLTTMGATPNYAPIRPQAYEETNMLLIQPSEQLTVRIDGQSDEGIILQPQGLLLILDGYITGGVELLNNNIETIIRGLMAGTGGAVVLPEALLGPGVVFAAIDDPDGYSMRVVLPNP